LLHDIAHYYDKYLLVHSDAIVLRLVFWLVTFGGEVNLCSDAVIDAHKNFIVLRNIPPHPKDVIAILPH
jgi:sulfur transfer complex TusBCD TusB component (DsrH family)